jgi:hypothetical protein
METSETEVIEQQETQVQEKPVFEKTVFGLETPPAPTQLSLGLENTQTETAAVENTETQTQVNEEAVQEDGVATFTMPSFGEDVAEANVGEEDVQNTTQVDWREEIKKQDRREVLKAAGLSDFAIEFAEYYEAGNDPYKYLEAKSFDWEKVGDIDVVKNDYKTQYPTFNDQQIDRLIAKKYGFIEDGDEEDNADALLMVKADAHTSRQAKIQQQKSFVIPTVAKPQEVAASQGNIEQLIAQQQEVAAQEYQGIVNFYQQHEATQNLSQSKRVGVDLGVDKPFYFSVDKPELVTKAITNGDFWQRITAVNPQEVDVAKLVPDVAKLQKLVVAAMNPNYEKDIFNYGKSFGLKAIVEEGQNAKKPNGTAPTVPNDSPTMAWGRAQVSNFGGNK